MYQIIDYNTKKPVQPTGFIFTGENSPWEILLDLAQIKSQLSLDYFKTEPPALAKYLPFMPILNPAEFTSLSETATPLIKSRTIGKNYNLELYFKVEGRNPTGSFKDRGSAVDVSVAKALGAHSIILASTGNMAASCACYATAAKIPCFILVPESVPTTKLAQIIAFGGKIIKVKGDYNDAAQLAKTLAKKMGFYLAGDYAFRVEGQKTAAFEIVDQLNFQNIDTVVVPMGCGTNIAAYAKGFHEYQQLGIIENLPKLVGVQAAGAAPIVQSFLQQAHTVTPFTAADTLASGIAIANPTDGIKALDALHNTKGFAIDVTDQEILQAQYLLSTEEGLFVETAAASSVAALIKAQQQGKAIQGKVVCVLTGDGMKDANILLQAATPPPTIDPDETSFQRLYESHYFEKANMIFEKKS